MAIQLRRGNYVDYDPTKMKDGEVAVVKAGDPATNDGKSAYIEISGDSKRIILEDDPTSDNTINFTTGDAADPSAWTDVEVVASGETHASLFNKITTMIKNNRWIKKFLGNTSISSIGDGTVTGAINNLNNYAHAANQNNVSLLSLPTGIFYVSNALDTPDTANLGIAIVKTHPSPTYESTYKYIQWIPISYTSGTVFVRTMSGSSDSGWIKLPTRAEINQLNTLTTLTLTRTENPYCDASSFARLSAFKRGGVVFLNGNLYLDFSQSTPSDSVEIGRISGWNAPTSISLTVPQQSNGSKIALIDVSYSGIIKIYTATGAASGFFRFSICVPYA